MTSLEKCNLTCTIHDMEYTKLRLLEQCRCKRHIHHWSGYKFSLEELYPNHRIHERYLE